MAETKTCSFKDTPTGSYYKIGNVFYLKNTDDQGMRIVFQGGNYMPSQPKKVKPDTKVVLSSLDEVLAFARKRHAATVEDGGFSWTIAIIVACLLGVPGLVLFLASR